MFKGKYLAGILAAYIAVFAICVYVQLSLYAHLAIMLVFVFLFILSIFVKNRRHMREKRGLLIFLAAVLLVFSFGYGEWFTAAKLLPVTAFADGRAHTVCATVEDIRYEKAYASAYVLHITHVDDTEISVGALGEIPYAGGFAVGDEIMLEGMIEEIGDEYQYYYRSRGILVMCISENVTRIGRQEVKISLFERIREKIAENFERHIGGEGANYATVLLTGSGAELDGQISLAYQRLGISHVLAVSGFHFSVIVGGLDFLFRAMTFPKKRKNIFLILFSLFFASVCGFSASIARAVIMFCLYYIADCVGERSDSLTSLFFAAACIVTVNPWSLYDAGFWLSVFSTLGILLVMPSMQSLFPRKKMEHILLRLGKKILSAILCLTVMNLTALFFTLPVTYFLYGGVSLISPLANLIFIPLTEIILYLSVILTLVGFVPFLAPLLGEICTFLIKFANEIALSLSDIRGIYISIRYPFAGIILIVLVIGVFAILFTKKFRVRRMFAVFLGAMISFAVCFGVYTNMGEDFSYLYLNTDGKNDVLCLVDDGEVMFIDAANGGRRVPTMAVKSLSEYYRCEIDTYVLTHLHAYHAGTLKMLADTIKIHRVMIPEAETEMDAEYITAITEALDGACEIVFYKRDGTETAKVGETVITLPDYEMISRSSHPVLLFSAETDGVGAWIYCGSCSMEFSEHWEDVKRYRAVIFGAHGPVVKNIFDEDCLSMAELVVFTSFETAALADAEKINGETVLVESEYHILFEH